MLEGIISYHRELVDDAFTKILVDTSFVRILVEIGSAKDTSRWKACIKVLINDGFLRALEIFTGR